MTAGSRPRLSLSGQGGSRTTPRPPPEASAHEDDDEDDDDEHDDEHDKEPPVVRATQRLRDTPPNVGVSAC
jgi:hypothetical protein